MLKMPIDKATVADAAELTRLVNSAYRGESSQKGWTSEAHLLDGIRIDEFTMIEYLNDSDTTILKYTNDDDRITGCVYLQLRNQRLYLGMLTVSPTLQAKGIGGQLLHAAEVCARQLECPIIFMTVITTRHELINWYRRRGYQPTGKIVPFPETTRFGVPKNVIELAVLEKEI
jgi:N-acetylglutamate synthase-like GNAT family acetyltransferase